LLIPALVEEQSLKFSIQEQIFSNKVVNKTAATAQLANCILLHTDQDQFFKTKTAFFKDHQIINPRPLA